MVLRSPEKLLKEAKTILDDSMQPDKTSLKASDDKIEKVSFMKDKNLQEKRPALGLKRAKFSAKPMPSQSDVVPEPNLDIGKLKDPTEFFAAFERMENAKKELQRLKGEPLVNLDQNVSCLSPRRRRPSLFGKSATYKHHSYSSTMVGDNGETFLSSQEKSEKHIRSPISQDSLPETDTVNNSQHVRVSDSTPAMTSELNELDELLSCDYGGLDEAGVLDVLQDKLQIKLRDIGKPALPDLRDVQRRESETSCGTLPQMTDAITRLNGIRKATGSKRLSLSSQLIGSSVHPQLSPVQPGSPLASISLLNRHISKLSPTKDPFSALEIDSPPVRIPSPETAHGKQSDQFDTRNNLTESQTLVHGEKITGVADPSPVLEGNSTTQSGEPKEQLDRAGQSAQDAAREDVQEHGASASAAHGEETTAVPGVFSPSLAANDISSTSEPKEWMGRDTQSGEVGKGTNLCDSGRSLAYREQTAADVGEDPLVSAAMRIDPTSQNKEQDDETTQVDAARDSVQLELNIEGSTTENLSASGVEDCTIDKALSTEDIVIEEPNKEASEPSKKKLEKGRKSKVTSRGDASRGTVKKGVKVNPQSDASVSEKPGNKKRKAEGAPRLSKREHLSRRNSLYAAGTKWEAGLRRSTRIRMRPLEYWRGERFLYGRVHDSLVTVIGVKYSSPSKEADQPAVKVKSFVSDEYKELVDLAALH